MGEHLGISHFGSERGLVLRNFHHRHPPPPTVVSASGECFVEFRHQRKGLCEVEGGPKGTLCLSRTWKQRIAKDL